MKQTGTRERIISLEAELNLLKAALAERPNLAVDEANWRPVRSLAKRVRKDLRRSVYGPSPPATA